MQFPLRLITLLIRHELRIIKLFQALKSFYRLKKQKKKPEIKQK